MVTDARKIAEYYLRALRQSDRTSSPTAPRPGKSRARRCSPAGPGAGPLLPLCQPHGAGEQRAAGARGFEKCDTPLKLALIGDAPYAQEYIQRVRDTNDPRIVMPGAIYGEGYHELQSHCFAYIHATEVGGTHPALIEAMGRGALVLYLNTPENAEVAGGAGFAFEPTDLPQKLQQVLAMSDSERAEWRARAAQRVRERYSWDAVTNQYETLLLTLRK